MTPSNTPPAKVKIADAALNQIETRRRRVDTDEKIAGLPQAEVDGERRRAELKDFSGSTVFEERRNFIDDQFY